MFCLRFFEWTTEALRSSSAPPNSGRRPEKRSAIDVECAFVGLKDFLFMASYFCSFTKEMMSLLSMAHMAPGTVLLAVCCWLRFDHKDCSRPPGKIQCTVLVSGLLCLPFATFLDAPNFHPVFKALAYGYRWHQAAMQEATVHRSVVESPVYCGKFSEALRL